MSHGKLSVYEVTVNGFKTKMQMTEGEARKRGLISDTPETAPAKETSPTPKPTVKKTVKQEGDE